MKPVFFKTPADFREWLEKNHDKHSELIVGYYKKHTKKPSITWPESVQQALCFGWIDGVRRSIDEESYTIRFTPRNPKSNWSKVNLNYMDELLANNLVHPAGKHKYDNRPPQEDAVASFEADEVELPKEYEKKLRANKKAWKHFTNKAPSYQKAAKWWLMSAKREETRERRLQHLIESSENEEPIKSLSLWDTKKKK